MKMYYDKDVDNDALAGKNQQLIINYKKRLLLE